AQIVTLRESQLDVPLGVARAQVRVAGDLEHPLGVSPAQVVFASRLAESLERELADGLEHPVALLAEPSGAAAEQALVEQGGGRGAPRVRAAWCGRRRARGRAGDRRAARRAGRPRRWG